MSQGAVAVQESDAIEVTGEQVDDAEQILTPEALAFVASLQRRFGARREHAIGGMAAFIPSRKDEDVNVKALAKVREDTEREATAEISRSQIWQWVHNESTLEDGTVITSTLVREVLDQEQVRILVAADGAEHRFAEARTIFGEVALADDFVDFLTLPAYAAVVSA